MSYCAILSFAAVFLQGIGYSNFSLGIIIAIGNIGGSLAGPLLASLLDSDPNRKINSLVHPLLITEAVLLTVLLFFAKKGVLTCVLYSILISLCTSVNSLDLRFVQSARDSGSEINYGLSRACGSLAFVIVSVLLGILAERGSVTLLPAAGLVILIIQFASHETMQRAITVPETAQIKNVSDTGEPLSRFLSANPRFLILLIGNVLIFFGHNTGTNFLINLVRGVGGDTQTMGYLNAFMAILEIPVMTFYFIFSRSTTHTKLLRFSFLMFALKTIVLAAANSVVFLFAAHLLQTVSFALYSAAIVPYINDAFPSKNNGKAQSLAFSTTVFGAVLASFISGWLFDRTSVTNTMLVASAVCTIGTVLSILGTTAPKKQDSLE